MVMLRPLDAPTLTHVRNDLIEVEGQLLTEDYALSEIELHLSDDQPHFTLGQTTVPATEGGVAAFGDFLGVPAPFLKRVGKTVGLGYQQQLLEGLLHATPLQAATVRFTEGAVRGVYRPGGAPVDPVLLVDIARRTIGSDDGYVQRLVSSQAEFSLDVHVPFTSDRGVGGDFDAEVELPEALRAASFVPPAMRDRQVGDVTAGGIRIGADLKRGLAPYVQPWLMRLACTNGMSVADRGLRVDARGSTVDEVLADVEAMAQRAFSRVEEQIEHLYRLRERRVDNPERWLLSTAREQDIPARSLNRLLPLASSDQLPDEPTEFDLVNLVTNLANDPAIRNDGGRQILESAGGAVIADEAARCGHCRQRVLA